MDGKLENGTGKRKGGNIMKYTNKQWEAWQTFDESEPDNTFWVVGIKGKELGQTDEHVCLMGDGFDEVRAKQIAALPELIEACQTAYDALHIIDIHYAREENNVAKMLKAALAKAGVK
jgi:hypothetical protein